MTRVLIASRTFEPEVNAAAFRLGAVAGGLAAAGASVEVLTVVPRADLRSAVTERAGIRVRRWPVRRDSGGNVRGYLQYLSYDIPLVFRLLFRRFDVAMAEAPPTTGVVVMLVCALKGKPFVYYAADVWADGVAAVGSPALVIRIIRALESTVIRRCARVLSVSDGVSERLRALGAPPTRIEMVGHGIDTETFHPAAAPAAPESRYFVYTGTMSEVHRPHVFVEAFARVAALRKDVRLKFFGQGVFETELRELADRLVPGRVDFGGVIPPAEAARWIRGSIAALVSLRGGIGYDYAHPTKAYAAAACGTPVLFVGPTDFGDLISEAGLGEAVSAQTDTDAVAESMTRLLRAADSGETEALRQHRADWARQNVSLAAVGSRASAAVLGVLPGSQKDAG